MIFLAICFETFDTGPLPRIFSFHEHTSESNINCKVRFASGCLCAKIVDELFSELFGLLAWRSVSRYSDYSKDLKRTEIPQRTQKVTWRSREGDQKPIISLSSLYLQHCFPIMRRDPHGHSKDLPHHLISSLKRELYTSSFLLLVVRRGAPSGVLAPSSEARSP